MNNPTHFIEVWKHSTGTMCYDHTIRPISWLDTCLKATKMMDVKGIYTVAIFKIKYK